MKIKKGLIFLVFIVLLIPLVFADDGGCCGDYGGLYCVDDVTYADCDSPNEWSQAYCEDTTFCDIGCCITDDGTCGINTGHYTCDQDPNNEWKDDPSCDSISECDDVCCIAGNTFQYTTESHCNYWWEPYNITPTIEYGLSEEECYDLGQAQTQGCCVTGDDICSYITLEECEAVLSDTSINMQTGTGFYEEQLCTDVSDGLQDAGIDVEDMLCDCDVIFTVDPELAYCEGDKSYVYDTCGNPVLQLECDEPDETCGVTQDAVGCISTNCENTYAFPTTGEGAHFSKYNQFPIYYIDNNGDWQEEIFKLGETRRHGEEWCIYESPTGGFSDRVGSQHYYAYCENGIEHITACQADRSEFCMMTYDVSKGKYQANNCETNNFGSYYTDTGDTEEDTDSGEEFTDTEQTYAYRSTPIEEAGVSTIPLATNFWEEEDKTCAKGTLPCKVVLGKVPGGGANYGWEVYVNSMCFRPEFALTAADYCRAQGDCGLNYNILEDTSDEDSFNIKFGGGGLGKDKVRDAYVGIGRGDRGNSAHQYYGAFSILNTLYGTDTTYPEGYNINYLGENPGQDLYEVFGPGEKTGSATTEDASIYGCFKRDLSGGEGYDYSRITQGQDYEKDLSSTFGSGVKGCYKYGYPQIEEGYYQYLNSLVQPRTYSREYMISPWWGLETVLYYSTAYILARHDDEYLNDGRDRNPSEGRALRLERVTEGLGFNVDPNIVTTFYTCAEPHNSLLGCSEDVSEILGLYEINSQQFGKLDYTLAQRFSSIKPWIIDKSKVYSEPNSAQSGTDWPPEGLSVFAGARGEDEDSEWSKTDNFEVYPVTYACNNWQGPTSGDYDCSLCDKPISEGGMIMDSDSLRSVEYGCNPFRCKSISTNCEYIDENEQTGRSTCVDGGCDPLDSPEILFNEELYDSQGILDNADPGSELGHDLNDLDVPTTYYIGFKTDQYTKCSYVDSEELDPSTINVVDEETEANLDLGEIHYSSLSTYSFTESPSVGYTDEHNITLPLTDGDDEITMYVWCKNYCGTVTNTFYQIKLTTAEGPDYNAPELKGIDPPTGSYAPADTETFQVTVYTDEPAYCKYSSTSTDIYESMENEFTDNSGTEVTSGLMSGFFQSSTSVDLTDGTNTFYLLCQDDVPHTWFAPEEWSVTKTEALEISQVAPEEGVTLYDSDVLLQIRTQKGAESGASECEYKQSFQNAYSPMVDTGDPAHWTQTQTLGQGSYTYDFKCYDIAGNENTTQITFNVDVDTYAPEVTNVYLLGTTMYILTDEATSCEYETSSFSYGSGFSTGGGTGTAHSFTTTSGINLYYVICQDTYGNVNSPFIINLDYLEEQ